MDRIEFEELSLKSLDPSLGPKPHRIDKPELTIEETRQLHISVCVYATLIFLEIR